MPESPDAALPPSLEDELRRASRRRYRATTARLERFGADEDTTHLVASIVQHLEQPRTARVGLHVQQRGPVAVEPHELAALAGVITLVLRNMNERAARTEALAEAVA